MRRFAQIVLLWALACLAALPAWAAAWTEERRVALLIGNENYTDPLVDDITTARADIDAVEKRLKALGFETTLLEDQTRSALLRSITKLIATLGKDDVFVLYYSGHGVEFGGVNYFAPIDVAKPQPGETPEMFAEHLVSLQVVLNALERRQVKTRIVIIDACREDPFFANQQLTASLGTPGGIAHPPAPRGTLIAYSAGPFQLSLYGLHAGDKHPNSLFTRVFVQYFGAPGLTVNQALRKTRNEVERLAAGVNHQQRPGVYDDLSEDWCPDGRCGSDDQAALDERRALEERNRDLEARLAALAVPTAPASPVSSVSSKIIPVVGVYPQTKSVFKDCADCPEMVVVPARSYDRGSPEGEEGRDRNEGPVRRVTIPRSFAVGRYEVSFAEWDACRADGGCGGYRPDDRWDRGKQPVINVSWQHAQSYVAWLSRKTGERYRLLTEAEWEYVARAGTKTPFWWGASISTDQANYDGNYTYGSGRKGDYRQRTVPVGSFAANPFGLYNVHGNVWEWVQDCYVDNYSNAPVDGTAVSGPDSCPRVLRGGSWGNVPRGLRSAIRSRRSPDDRGSILGFRLARMLSD